MILENFYFAVLKRIDGFLSGRNWLLKLTLFSVGLSLFLAFPPYQLLLNHLNGTGNLDAWAFIKNQGENILAPADIGAHIRRENMIFRWTLPALSFLTGHNVPVIVLLQALLGFAFIYFLAKYAYELTGSKISAALFALSVSHIFVGVWYFAEVHGYGDGIAYFCLFVAMLHPNTTVTFLMMLLACFTDERAVLAGGFVILWNITNTAYLSGNFGFKSLVSSAFRGRNTAIWLSWIVYFAIRLTVKKIYFPGHNYSTMGTPVLFEQAHRNGLGSSMWGVFEGFWLVLIASVIVLWGTKKYSLAAVLIIGFTVLMVSGLFVHDIDRSLSYGFPFLLISFFLLHKNASVQSFHLVFFFCTVVCILHPQLFYMGYNRILWLEPLPLKVLQLFDRIKGWNLFS